MLPGKECPCHQVLPCLASRESNHEHQQAHDESADHHSTAGSRRPAPIAPPVSSARPRSRPSKHRLPRNSAPCRWLCSDRSPGGSRTCSVSPFQAAEPRTRQEHQASTARQIPEGACGQAGWTKTRDPAFALGTHLQMGSGQDQHLPLKEGMPVKDDEGLAHEMDVMEEEALCACLHCPGDAADTARPARSSINSSAGPGMARARPLLAASPPSRSDSSALLRWGQRCAANPPPALR